MREIPRSLEEPRRLKALEGIDFSDECHILMCGMTVLCWNYF
jgi:hypothetical protein